MLTIVGAGPGSQEYLLPLAQQAVAEAELVIGAKRLVDKLATPDCAKVYLKDINYSAQKILALAKGKKTVLLVSGDPGLFSLTKKITSLTSKVKIIPGISAAQLFFARLLTSWENVIFISLHGKRTLDSLKRLKTNQDYLFFLNSGQSLNQFADQLSSRAAAYQFYLGLDLGLASEKVQQLDLKQLAQVELQPGQLALLYLKSKRRVNE